MSGAALSMRERDFRWQEGERLVRFASGSLAETPTLLAERGLDPYVLLSTERAVAMSSATRSLAAGAASVLSVPPGPVPDAAAAVRTAVGRRPVVALGGGRVIDAAKAIAATDGLRCAAVPTTLSGAEMTRLHRLPAGVERPPTGLARPELVVADPDAMASQPRPALTASAMNALAHGAEALYAPGANPVSDLVALRGAELIARGLERSEPDRQALAVGSIMCAWALAGTGLSLLHALCQTVVRVTRAPHAATYAVMLAPVLARVSERAPAPLGQLAVALGAQEEDPARAAELTRALAADSGVTRLSDLGIGGESLDPIVEAAARRPEMQTPPGQAGPRELRGLLIELL